MRRGRTEELKISPDLKRVKPSPMLRQTDPAAALKPSQNLKSFASGFFAQIAITSRANRVCELPATEISGSLKTGMRRQRAGLVPSLYSRWHAGTVSRPSHVARRTHSTSPVARRTSHRTEHGRTAHVARDWRPPPPAHRQHRDGRHQRRVDCLDPERIQWRVRAPARQAAIAPTQGGEHPRGDRPGAGAASRGPDKRGQQRRRDAGAIHGVGPERHREMVGKKLPATNPAPSTTTRSRV